MYRSRNKSCLSVKVKTLHLYWYRWIYRGKYIFLCIIYIPPTTSACEDDSVLQVKLWWRRRGEQGCTWAGTMRVSWATAVLAIYWRLTWDLASGGTGYRGDDQHKLCLLHFLISPAPVQWCCQQSSSSSCWTCGHKMAAHCGSIIYKMAVMGASAK